MYPSVEDTLSCTFATSGLPYNPALCAATVSHAWMWTFEWSTSHISIFYSAFHKPVLNNSRIKKAIVSFTHQVCKHVYQLRMKIKVSHPYLSLFFFILQWWPIQLSQCRLVTRTTWRTSAPSLTVAMPTTTLFSTYHSATTAAPNSPTGWVCPTMFHGATDDEAVTDLLVCTWLLVVAAFSSPDWLQHYSGIWGLVSNLLGIFGLPVFKGGGCCAMCCQTMKALQVKPQIRFT